MTELKPTEGPHVILETDDMRIVFRRMHEHEHGKDTKRIFDIETVDRDSMGSKTWRQTQCVSLNSETSLSDPEVVLHKILCAISRDQFHVQYAKASIGIRF